MFPRSKSYRICFVYYKLSVITVLKNYVPQYCYDSNGKKKLIRGIIFSEAWVKFDITRAYLVIKTCNKCIIFKKILRADISLILFFDLKIRSAEWSHLLYSHVINSLFTGAFQKRFYEKNV